MTSMSQTKCLESLEGERVLLEAEPQLLRRQLEDEQRAHLATCEDAARASRQLRVRIAALENENRRLHRALEHARKFAPQLYTNLPLPYFESKGGASTQFAIASSSSASTQSNET